MSDILQPEKQVKSGPRIYQARISTRVGESKCGGSGESCRGRMWSKFQCAKGKIVFGDNDKKLHSDVYKANFSNYILSECVIAAYSKVPPKKLRF